MQTLADIYTHLPGHELAAAQRFFRMGLSQRVAHTVLDGVTSMEDWVPRWTQEAQQWEQWSQEEAARGHGETSKAHARQAFFLYRVAEFAVLQDSDRKRDLYQGTLRTWEMATSAPTVDMEKVQSREGFPGLVMRPHGTTGRLPTILYIQGADSNKEEQYWNAGQLATARGMLFCIFDGPGQGYARKIDGIVARPDYEVPVQDMLDYLRSRGDVDWDRILIWGSSMGGYYGLRAFALLPDVRACLANSALYDAVKGLAEFYPSIMPQLAYNMRTETKKETLEALQEYSLQGLVEQIDRPVAVYHGDRDAIVDPKQAEILRDRLPESACVNVWEGGTHNLGNVWELAGHEMADWLADHGMGGGTPRR